MNELTPREREVFILMLLGCDSKDIGRRLSISWRTVCDHRGKVLRKCEARNVVDLVRAAYETEEAAQ